MIHRLSFLVFGLTALLFTSCKKDEMGSVTVNIHDSGAPVTYDEVVIDVRRVEVKFANANTNNEFGKYFLDAHNQQFDLASLSDSADAEIANKKRIPTGALTEMRIVAGDDNYVKINGVKYDLIVSNAPNSGLTFPLDDKGIYAGQQAKIVLNIDVASSVVQSGGSYTLNPLITVE
ncbi:MAG: DUF4382 domain-containing protein [Bacteroidia bacterium]